MRSVKRPWWEATSSEEPAGSDALLNPLRAARSRFALQIRLNGAAWAALAAIAVVGILALLRYGAAAYPALPTISGWLMVAIALAVLVLGLIGAAIHTRRSIPDLLWVARRADRHLELDERLGTAVELGYPAPGSPPPGPVLTALVRDAERHASRVQPESLVKLRVPRPTWFVLAGLVAVFALELAPRADAVERSARETAIELAASQSPEAILAAAQLLEEEAEELGDPELMAVANAMRELGESIAEEGSSEQEMTDFEIAELLEQAMGDQEAVDGNGESSDLPPPGDESGEAGGEANSKESPDGASSSSEARSALEALMGRLNPGQRAALEKALAEAEAPSEGGMRGPGTSAQRDRSTGAPSQLAAGDLQFQQLMEDEVQQMMDGSDVASAVAGAGAGSSSSPFDGGQDGDLPGLESLGRRELELSIQQGNANRRLGTELPPETQFTAVPGQTLGVGPWRAGSADALLMDHLSISYRSVASRYFVSMTQQPATAVEP